MPWLVPRNEDLATQKFDQRLVVGREGDVGLLIRDPAVSRIHCVLQQVRDGSWKMHDPGSRNGTFVNGRRVEKIVTLKDGDILGIGSPREQNAWEFRLSPPRSKHEPEKKVDSLVMTRLDMPAVAEFAPQQNVENTDVLRRDYERLRGAWQLMQRLAGHTSQETLLENALDALIDMFQAERGVAMLRDAHGLLRRVAQRSRTSEAAVVANALLNEVLENRQAVISRDALSDERFSESRTIMAAGVRATMAAPLIHGGDVLGVVIIDSSKSLVSFHDQDLEVFETAARQIALSLHTLQLAESVREKEAMRERFERLVTPSLAAQIADGSLSVDRQGRVRNVSVLFSDIRGFTSMSEEQDATALVGLLNTYFEDMVDIVFEYEGTLDKFIGDAVMAIFGAPADQPDHADRAVKAAVKMQRRLHELVHGVNGQAPRLSVPFDIGIGVNSGEVVAGFLGSPMALDYTVVGDVVNTASRICGAAPPWKVLIGESTRAQLRGSWALTEIDAIEAKGKSDRVAVFDVGYDLGYDLGS